jgi:hypothetical protein
MVDRNSKRSIGGVGKMRKMIMLLIDDKEEGKEIYVERVNVEMDEMYNTLIDIVHDYIKARGEEQAKEKMTQEGSE